MQWLKEHRGLQLESYDALWQWSVTDLESFWGSIWDYFGIQASAPFERVLGRRDMPGAEWFPGARLNYAGYILARERPEATAILSLREGVSFALHASQRVLDKLGTFGTFTKVNLGDDRFGFVETKTVKDNAAATGKIGYRPHLSHSPPLLEVTPAKLATREDEVHIEGQAIDGHRVLDAFIFVGPRKVFYQSNRKAADPTKLKFAIDTELQPGINVITVVARESDDSATRTTMIVRRDGPNGEPLPSPKGESAGEDWSISGDGD